MRVLVGLAACFAGLAPIGATAQATVSTLIRTDEAARDQVELTGPSVEIPADLGWTSGGNLFHSFERFDVGTRSLATFTRHGLSESVDIDHVVVRVTGSAPSQID